MTRTLSERLRTHEQRRARLAEAEAKLKLDERKERTRRLVQAGALVEKAGLLGLDSNALYGALLSLTDDAADLSKVATWSVVGGRRFEAEARARDEGKQPLLLTFPAPLAKDATTALRKAGFRYSRVLQHWEGLARPEDAEALAGAHGGAVRQVRAMNGAAVPSPAHPPAPGQRPRDDHPARSGGRHQDHGQQSLLPGDRENPPAKQTAA